ncbi:MAG: PH domain-containing protein [Halobacteria archaeon]|nr:PH domain-containing protein [Halobacteria archaeon]
MVETETGTSGAPDATETETPEYDFDWVTFDDDEEVVWADNPHRESMIPAIAIGILLIPLLGLGLVIIGASYVHLKNTVFVITNKRVYKKQGTLSRNVSKIGYDKIQNTSFSQGFLGKYFNYGSVELSTAGGQGVEMRFRR